MAAALSLMFMDRVSPAWADRAPVAERVISATVDPTILRAPWTHAPVEEALSSPQFQADRQAFAEDLLRTGKVSEERADEIAGFAVREAYRRRVPPALVFGVLMTENGDLKSGARSNVGATGLMQIDPKAWLRPLGKKFGTNLKDDETNLRYGVFILSYLMYHPNNLEADEPLRRGLLRYNGCVKGTNTKNCHSYPDVVRRKVEHLAVAQCGDGGYEACVTRPLQLSLKSRAGEF